MYNVACKSPYAEKDRGADMEYKNDARLWSEGVGARLHRPKVVRGWDTSHACSWDRSFSISYQRYRQPMAASGRGYERLIHHMPAAGIGQFQSEPSPVRK